MLEDISFLFNGADRSYFTLLLFTFSVAMYAVLIYVFYKFVSRRDVFGFNIEQYKKKKSEDIFHKLHNFLLSVIKYGIVFPIIIFVWFAGFSAILFFFSKSLSIPQIILLSITMVSAIRILSYINEELAAEVAKLLPLTLLAVFLSSPDFFSIYIDERIYLLPTFIKDIAQLLFFSIFLEWILRILFFVRVKVLGLPEEEDQKEKEQRMEVEIEEKIIDKLTEPKN